jgi:hypothetical protein
VSKLDKSDLGPLLKKFKEENRLLDTDALVDVTETARMTREDLDDLAQQWRGGQEQVRAVLDQQQEDIATLQRNTEPAHKYECFGSDQAVKIFQIETKLSELEGLTAGSVDRRLDKMNDRIDSTSSQMDRVLGVEAFINSNFDRIGTDYVHLSRLISDINEELSGHDVKMRALLSEPRGQQAAGTPAPHPVTTDGMQDAKIAKLIKDVEGIEQAINSADYRIAAFADECRDSLLDLQTNSDKKIDILAVWVSKNINLLAASTRKKLKQLLAGDSSALLAGQNGFSRSSGHCLSCNQTKRPTSANNPKTRVTEGKSPIFKITHIDHLADDHRSDAVDDAASAEGPSFRMTVPASLRSKVTTARHPDADERQHAEDSSGMHDSPLGVTDQEESWRAR